MEKHINKFSSRIVSLYSKTILINTLILSKTSYLINVFSLDAEIVLKTHSKIFKYLRNNKRTEPISRKKLFLNKTSKSNLIEPEDHNYAIRIKHLLTLKQKKESHRVKIWQPVG